MKTTLKLLAALCAGVVLNGCGGSGGSGGGPTFYAILATEGIVGSDYTTYSFRLHDRNAKQLDTTENLSLQGLDQRPATGDLYTYDPVTEILYTVDLSDGRFHIVGQSPDDPPEGAFAMDFNPSVDRIRLVDKLDGTNMRLNPNNVAIAGVDTDINPAAEIGEIAYANNIAGSATTTLYAINATTMSLARIGGVDGSPSPNTGILTTVGPLGIGAAVIAGFDIAADGTAYLLTQTNSFTTVTLYTVDLTTGAATLVGSVDNIQSGLILGFAHVD